MTPAKPEANGAAMSDQQGAEAVARQIATEMDCRPYDTARAAELISAFAQQVARKAVEEANRWHLANNDACRDDSREIQLGMEVAKQDQAYSALRQVVQCVPVYAPEFRGTYLFAQITELLAERDLLRGVRDASSTQ